MATLADMMAYDAANVLLNTNDTTLQSLDLQKATTTKDGLGGTSFAWSTIATAVQAVFIPRRADLMETIGKEVVETTHHLVGAYTQATGAANFTKVLTFQRGSTDRKALRFKWVELEQTRYFSIETAMDLGEEHRWIRCDVVERAAAWWN